MPRQTSTSSLSTCGLSHRLSPAPGYERSTEPWLLGRVVRNRLYYIAQLASNNLAKEDIKLLILLLLLSKYWFQTCVAAGLLSCVKWPCTYIPASNSQVGWQACDIISKYCWGFLKHFLKRCPQQYQAAPHTLRLRAPWWTERS